MSPQSQAESACHSVPRCLRKRKLREIGTRKAASEGAVTAATEPRTPLRGDPHAQGYGPYLARCGAECVDVARVHGRNDDGKGVFGLRLAAGIHGAVHTGRD